MPSLALKKYPKVILLPLKIFILCHHHTPQPCITTLLPRCLDTKGECSNPTAYTLCICTLRVCLVNSSPSAPIPFLSAVLRLTPTILLLSCENSDTTSSRKPSWSITVNADYRCSIVAPFQCFQDYITIISLSVCLLHLTVNFSRGLWIHCLYTYCFSKS